jgi:hypothetical protein
VYTKKKRILGFPGEAEGLDGFNWVVSHFKNYQIIAMNNHAWRLIITRQATPIITQTNPNNSLRRKNISAPEFS